MNTMKVAPSLLLLSFVGLSSIVANAQSSAQDVTETIRSSQTAEERVAEEVKPKQLRRAAEEELAAEEAARVAETSP